MLANDQEIMGKNSNADELPIEHLIDELCFDISM